MEKGKWYKLSNGKGNIEKGWYIEFDRYKDDKNQTVMATRHISPYSGGTLRLSGQFNDKDYYTFTEIHKSEIQEFLPIEERDLVINNYSLW